MKEYIVGWSDTLLYNTFVIFEMCTLLPLRYICISLIRKIAEFGLALAVIVFDLIKAKIIFFVVFLHFKLSEKLNKTFSPGAGSTNEEIIPWRRLQK